MSKKEFHNRLFEFMHREPFVPFVVRLREGDDILIKQPPIVWCEGAASFIDLDDGALVDFVHTNVKRFELTKNSRAIYSTSAVCQSADMLTED